MTTKKEKNFNPFENITLGLVYALVLLYLINSTRGCVEYCYELQYPKQCKSAVEVEPQESKPDNAKTKARQDGGWGTFNW